MMEQLDKMLRQANDTKMSSFYSSKKNAPRKPERNSAGLQKHSVCNGGRPYYLHKDSRSISNRISDKFITSMKESPSKLSTFYLTTDPDFRTPEQLQFVARIISEQKLFPELGTDPRVLYVLAQYLRLSSFEAGRIIYDGTSTNENVLKVYEGMVEMQGGEGGQCETQSGFVSNKSMREKGEFLETIQNFGVHKKWKAKSLTKSSLLSVPFRIYSLVSDFYENNKKLVKMLRKTSMFQKFSQKELLALLQSSQQIKLYRRQTLFTEGQSIVSHSEDRIQDRSASLINVDYRMMYLIVEGEISITKKCKNKVYSICSIGEGNFVGDEAIFLDEVTHRQYSASVLSLRAKLLPITNKDLQEWIKSKALGINFEAFTGKLRRGIRQKLAHYENALQQAQKIKSSIFVNVGSQSLTESKRQNLKNISNIVGQVCQKVQGMQKIKARRLNFKSYSNQVSFQEPLFTRKDFPEIEGYLKRFENEQKKALDKYRRGGSLHHP